jgi:hypothetical protein
MRGSPEYQAERALPSDRSRKSTIADPKLEYAKPHSDFIFHGASFNRSLTQ